MEPVHGEAHETSTLLDDAHELILRHVPPSQRHGSCEVANVIRLCIIMLNEFKRCRSCGTLAAHSHEASLPKYNSLHSEADSCQKCASASMGTSRVQQNAAIKKEQDVQTSEVLSFVDFCRGLNMSVLPNADGYFEKEEYTDLHVNTSRKDQRQNQASKNNVAALGRARLDALHKYAEYQERNAPHVQADRSIVYKSTKFQRRVRDDDVLYVYGISL